MKPGDNIWVRGIIKEQSGQSVLVQVEGLGSRWFSPDKYTTPAPQKEEETCKYCGGKIITTRSCNDQMCNAR